MARTLPPFPSIHLSIVGDTTSTSRCDEGFVRVRRRRLQLTYPDGHESQGFPYDEAWREALDAVVIAAHYRDATGERCVYLRSAMRPPVALRPLSEWPVPERKPLGQLWELPAGLVEAPERSPEGLRLCASRELAEEVGFHLDPSNFHTLGPALFPTPGLIAERLFFFHVEVNPTTCQTPLEDGSALERGAHVVALPLSDCLRLAQQGELGDMKTEVGLRRLAELP